MLHLSRKWFDADMYRLKKVQGKKKRDTAAREAAQEQNKQPTTAVDSSLDDTEGAGDLLSSKDEDVIF